MSHCGGVMSGSRTMERGIKHRRHRSQQQLSGGQDPQDVVFPRAQSIGNQRLKLRKLTCKIGIEIQAVSSRDFALAHHQVTEQLHDEVAPNEIIEPKRVATHHRKCARLNARAVGSDFTLVLNVVTMKLRRSSPW